MDDEIILSYLEELADQLGIMVRDENINLEETFSIGGLCRVEGKYILILNSKATIKEKIEVSVKALQQFDLNDMYVKPVIRELLENTMITKIISSGQKGVFNTMMLKIGKINEA
ncbi:MAG TPA: hypothetical protein PLV50_14385 [Smithella sp.]|nr:hypothetical protein [Smithella sp.]HQN37798.1 hypothetical protein [Caldisericia bacterium]